MKGLDAFILVVLFVTLGLGIYILVQSLPGKTVEFESGQVSVKGNSSGVFTNKIQFYPNMRYPDRTINYTIYPSCDAKKQQSVEAALSILESETILKFNKTAQEGEIQILCDELTGEQVDERHFVAGEGGPVDIFVSGPFHVITRGKISLYRNEKCDQPQITLHELLHALGFDHNNDQKSILYPVSSCDEQLDSYITDEINRLYQINSAPDLSINSASASKSGKYLNFAVEVSNDGLKNAEEVTLHIYAEDEEVKNVSLGSLPLGSRKKITAEYVVVPKDTSSIRMVVKTGESELSITNNEIELTVKEG